MKISHTLKIQEDGLTISGRITGVEWEDNESGDEKDNRDYTETFFISSINYPKLVKSNLYIRGNDFQSDNDFVTHKYNTKGEAKAMMDFILENTIKEIGFDPASKGGDRSYKVTANVEDGKINVLKVDYQFEVGDTVRFDLNGVVCIDKIVSISNGLALMENSGLVNLENLELTIPFEGPIEGFKPNKTIVEEEWKPKEGEVILVKDLDGERKTGYTYLCKNSGGLYVCYITYNGEEYKNVVTRDCIKQIKPTITIDGKKYLKSDIDKLTPIDN